MSIQIRVSGYRVGVLVVMAAALATVALSSEHPIYFGDGGEDAVRRQLGQAGYVSYGALNRNNVPCNQRGQSYYNCRSHQNANPYNRGCTRVTNCARASR